MKTYEETKDSNLDWLGDIPSHWQVKRLKNIARINPLKNIADDADEMTTFLPMEKVSEKGEIDCSLKRPVKDLLVGFTYFEKNDIILAKITPCFENGKGAYLDKLDTPFGFGSTEFHVIRTLEKLDSTFLYYVTTSNLFRDLGEASMTGSGGQKRVPTSFVENFPLAFPPLPEQHAIAAYLDRKTAQLDTLLAQKEALLQMLHQKRQALINEAVTQGMDPAAPRKPSGVAWLGDVPAHWEVKKLKYVMDFFNTVRVPLSAEERGLMSNPKYDYYGASGVIDKVDNYHFDGEYILLAEDGANLLSRSSPLAFKATGKFWVNNHAHILRPKNGILDYYINLLESLDYTIYVTGSAQPKLTMGNLANVSLPVPPVQEQNEIQNHLHRISSQLMSAENQIHTQIKTLKAYRQSLISEVVTGKVDVRPAEAVAPEADLPLWRR